MNQIKHSRPHIYYMLYIEVTNKSDLIDSGSLSHPKRAGSKFSHFEMHDLLFLGYA